MRLNFDALALDKSFGESNFGYIFVGKEGKF